MIIRFAAISCQNWLLSWFADLCWKIQQESISHNNSRSFSLYLVILTIQSTITRELSGFTLPSRIDVTPRQLIFWEFSTQNSVISATTFIINGPNFAPPRFFFFGITVIKIKESSSSGFRNSVISVTASLKIRECFQFSHKNVKIKLLNAWLCTRKNKSFECGIVINCFQNICRQMYKRLNTGVISIRFYSTEQKTMFLYTSSWKICTMKFCIIQRRCRNLLLCFRLAARISKHFDIHTSFFLSNKKKLLLTIINIYCCVRVVSMN